MSLADRERLRRGSIVARQLWALSLKELRQLVRDRAVFGFVLYIFTLDLLLNASGGWSDLANTPLSVRDLDQSELSRELVARLRAPYFRPVSPAMTPEAGERALDRGEAKLILELPPDLSARVANSSEQVPVQVLIDSSKVFTAYMAGSYTVEITETLNEGLAAGQLRRLGIEPSSLPRVENAQRTIHTVAANDGWSHALSGLLAMLTFACVMLPGTALVREQERGTAEQLLVSPLTPLGVLIPKVASMTLVSVLGMAVAIFGILQPLVDLPCRGSVALLLGMTAAFASATAGLGIFLATLSRTTAQLGLLTILIVLPIVQLSGLWNTVATMPVLLRHLIELSPLRHFSFAIYGILLKGWGLGSVWRHALAMVLFGVAVFALAAWRSRAQAWAGGTR